MKNLITILLTLVITATTACAAPPPPYAVAKIPTPVLNTPDFAAVFGGKDGHTLKTDSCGLIRAMEFIALPGTAFTIEGEVHKGALRIFKVTTADYPYAGKTGYYIDSRFVQPSATKPQERLRHLPARQAIIDDMLAAVGSPYVWGGNIRTGIGQMLSFYPPTGALDPRTENLWQQKGVDCSGLLYEATNGFTPRNTSELVGYGKGLAIAGKTVEQIASLVEPLDIIVWSGHVIIILDKERTIESYLDCGGPGGGVVVRPLRRTLATIMGSKTPLNDYRAATKGKKGFVIRRWYGDAVGL